MGRDFDAKIIITYAFRISFNAGRRNHLLKSLKTLHSCDFWENDIKAFAKPPTLNWTSASKWPKVSGQIWQRKWRQSEA